MPGLCTHLEEDSPMCLAILGNTIDPLGDNVILQDEGRRVTEAQHAMSLGYHVCRAFKPPVQISGPQLDPGSKCKTMMAGNHPVLTLLMLMLLTSLGSIVAAKCIQ